MVPVLMDLLVPEGEMCNFTNQYIVALQISMKDREGA